MRQSQGHELQVTEDVAFAVVHPLKHLSNAHWQLESTSCLMSNRIPRVLCVRVCSLRDRIITCHIKQWYILEVPSCSKAKQEAILIISFSRVQKQIRRVDFSWSWWIRRSSDRVQSCNFISSGKIL